MFGCFDGFPPPDDQDYAQNDATRSSRRSSPDASRHVCARSCRRRPSHWVLPMSVRGGATAPTMRAGAMLTKQWNYERGRQWVQQAPRTVALKRNGKISDEALVHARHYLRLAGDATARET